MSYEPVSESEWIASIATDVAQTMMSVGYVASSAGLSADARRIFAGLVAIRPNSELPWIGLSMNELNIGRVGKAKEAIEQACVRNPTSELCQVFSAVVLRAEDASGNWKQIASHVAEEGTDEVAKNLAVSICGHS